MILLVREVEERRVMEGWLGCSHCRHDFPVRRGVADLRLHPDEDIAPSARVEDEELGLKVLALTGLAEERTYLVMDEALAHVAEDVADMAPDLEVITLRRTDAASEERPGVSRILVDEGFPFLEYRLRGVAMAARAEATRVRAAARRIATGGRLVLFDASPADLEEVERGGLKVLASQAGTAVAERHGGSLPIVG